MPFDYALESRSWTHNDVLSGPLVLSRAGLVVNETG